MRHLENNYPSMEDSNRLIAEFMDYKLENGYWVATTSHEDDTFLGKHLLFLTSWDWLMPVVRKCDDLTVDDMVKLGDIADTYSAVVEFIKWYKGEEKVEFIKEHNKKA